ncbi:MAG: PqqD family protein [Lentisphaerae bacterium]|nr:PqqD family protein [Lentisphaerota bacterium]
MEISKNTLVSLSDKQEYSDFNGEIVMINIQNGNYYNLPYVGTAVWKLLEASPMSIENIADSIITEFDIDKERFIKDLTSFIIELKKNGLVDIS